MTKLRSVLVLLFALVLSVSFAVPAEDVPETAYDESESLPYESTPVVSIAVSETVTKAPAVRAHVPLFRLGSLRLEAQHLDLGTGSAYPISDSLTILDHSLRC